MRYTIKELHIVNDMNKAMDKLSKLEDIEDNIGIDLITLFKVWNDGVYLYTDNCGYSKLHVGKVKYKNGDTIDLENKCFIINECCGQGDYHTHTLYFKDYGKTWALTREELK